MSRNISPERKLAYYGGMVIVIIGALTFGSTFVSAALNFGNFDHFEERGKSMALRAFGGMGMLIVGAIVMGVGARGLAGSGVVLDPKKAREELEPFSRMAGGMVKDALDEADIHIGNRPPQDSPPQKIVMIKCPACGKLNEEDSNFCQECGQKF